jgi:hypothetical protein
MTLEQNRAELPVPTLGDDDGWDAEMAWAEPKYKKGEVKWVTGPL